MWLLVVVSIVGSTMTVSCQQDQVTSLADNFNSLLSVNEPTSSSLPEGDMLYGIYKEYSSATSSSSLSSVNCDVSKGWISYSDGKCYNMVTTRTSWNDASANCHAIGGTLASLHSDIAVNLTALFVAESLTCAVYWIGLNDKKYEAEADGDHPGWVYTDGSTADYRLWLSLPDITFPLNDTWQVGPFILSYDLDCVASTPLGFSNWPCNGWPKDPLLEVLRQLVLETLNNDLINQADPTPAEFCALCQRTQGLLESSSSSTLGDSREPFDFEQGTEFVTSVQDGPPSTTSVLQNITGQTTASSSLI